MLPATIELVSVNVALPAQLGIRRGKPVISGIAKKPVRVAEILVTQTGIDGDGQGDLVNHGGVDKAIYIYPADHLPVWTAEHGRTQPYGPGDFGENLTVGGWREQDVHIGDRWQWGEVIVEVAQPRYPCFKLGMHLNRSAVVRELVANHRTGWYVRVLQPGTAQVDQPLTFVERTGSGVSVLDAHLARLPTASAGEIERVIAEPALADRLRAELAKTLRQRIPVTR